MESEDGTANDICHTDQATDASTNAKEKPKQHGGMVYIIGSGLSNHFCKGYSVLLAGNNSLVL
jgi:hypothetical protein